MAPQTPQRSSRPGKAVARLYPTVVAPGKAVARLYPTVVASGRAVARLENR